LEEIVDKRIMLQTFHIILMKISMAKGHRIGSSYGHCGGDFTVKTSPNNSKFQRWLQGREIKKRHNKIL